MSKRLLTLTALATALCALSTPIFAQGPAASTRPALAPAAPAKVFPVLAPDPIERPEFMNKAHPIAKNVTTATAMMVREESDGGLMGLTSDVIATVPLQSRQGSKFDAVFISKQSGQADVGKEMQTSFEEALRAVKLRYPKWDPGIIEFSFGEKYTPHDGGSAGTCFAVMMLSALEGFDIDPKMAVTGDITADWKVRKIGGVAAKLRGATADHCLYASIPEENAAQLSDMALMYGVDSLRDIQIFSSETLQDAVALLREDRAPQLVEAMTEFADLQPKLKAESRAGINFTAHPENEKALEQILAYAPNHQSAKWLLDTGRGKAPKTLSPMFALYQIMVITYPYHNIIEGKEPVNRSTATIAMNQAAVKELNQIRPVAPREIQDLLRDATIIINTTESIAKREPIPATTFNAQRQSFFTHLQALASDKALVEKMLREGY